jgi:hypothetical protein
MRRLFALFALLLAFGFTLAPAHAAPQVAPVTHKYTATAAHVSTASPRQNSTVSVSAKLLDQGKAIAGALMTATWHYKTTTSYCSGVTLANGVATCSRRISRATIGFRVGVTLTFTKGGKTLATAYTGFTPR